MVLETLPLENKVALVTGAAKRLGASSVKALHAAGSNVIVHYHTSQNEANQLVADLNAKRLNSAVAVRTELGSKSQAELCMEQAMSCWNRLDILVNNASTFYETSINDINEKNVSDLFSSNVSGPLFLIQAAHKELSQRRGSVINMVDIHGLRPYQHHSVYCAAKSALIMLTTSLALELAPQVRVNGIAPGAILWPSEIAENTDKQNEKTREIPMGRSGTPDDIANLIVFLCSESANYITGEIIKVDGGRSI